MIAIPREHGQGSRVRPIELRRVSPLGGAAAGDRPGARPATASTQRGGRPAFGLAPTSSRPPRRRDARPRAPRGERPPPRRLGIDRKCATEDGRSERRLAIARGRWRATLRGAGRDDTSGPSHRKSRCLTRSSARRYARIPRRSRIFEISVRPSRLGSSQCFLDPRSPFRSNGGTRSPASAGIDRDETLRLRGTAALRVERPGRRG